MGKTVGSFTGLKRVTVRKFILLLFTLLLISNLSAQEDNSRPNVVVVLADDIGLGDLSGYRRAHTQNIIVETPNLDQLMREGMSFTDAHSPAALCAPSRYSVMTGNNTYHNYAPWGVWGAYQPSPIKQTDMTLGKLMQKAGYQTAFFGKWHMGGDWLRKSKPTEIYRGPRNKPQLDIDITKIVGAGPKEQGFEYSLMFPAGIQNVPYAVYENHTWMPLHPESEITEITQKKMDGLNVILDKEEGLGDSHWDPHDMGPLLANKAVDYITKATTDQPFFLYYCSQAVHLPHTPPVELNGQKIKGSTPTAHLDMIKELDVQMGMLITALKEKGVYENTLFIFTSDNGGLVFAKTMATGHRPSDIYRGGKNQIYEGGHRVPFIATWPNEIPAGKTSNALLSGTDILQTLAELTGQELEPTQAMDSYSLLPLLKADPQSAARKQLLIQGGTGREVIIRDGDWKLIIQYTKDGSNQPKALFDLSDNLTENDAKNLIEAPQQQQRIERMYQTYNAIRNEKRQTGSK
ncbi:MAG: arylsulfatase [Bacteroidota bacterium]